jgi:D-alanyl-lipoteichoic acid acyltransferase DltB (MBOAT superfamily)
MIPHKYRWTLLLFASCWFYMTFIPIYILILFFTIIIDYYAGILIEKSEEQKKKPFLIASIIANVGVLCVFKYYNFFADNINTTSTFLNFNFNIPFLKIILPIGLSFHTFQAMSYTIEVYRGNQKAEKHFGIYALYVMFYPQLVAGPIERPQNMIHQFHEKHFFNHQNTVDGLRQILWGIFKKAVIADRLGIVVDDVYKNYHQLAGLPLFIAAFLFPFQLLCDFSGYSDIAIGTAKVMGFDLMKNFDNPFKSKNITEFWRRWHISLSTWFRDYLYTPIVINKRDWGIGGVIFALFLTFSLSGLWHGAGWTFIIFGLLHGFAAVYETLTKKLRKNLSKKTPIKIYNSLSVIITFIFIAFTWIFFRSQNLEQVNYILTHLFDFNSSTLFFSNFMTYNISIGFILVILFIGFELLQNGQSIAGFLSSITPFKRWLFYIITCLLILNFGVFGNNQFIYFQF